MKRTNFHEDFLRHEITKVGSNRNFGLTFSLLFFVIAFAPLAHHNPIKLWALISCSALLLISLFRNGLLSPFTLAWMRLGLVLNSIMSPIILFVLFYLIFLPVGLMLKILKKDILLLKQDPTVKTYWITSAPLDYRMKDQF